MGQIIVKDLADEAGATRDSSGLKVTRKFMVSGLTGEGSARMLEALDTPDIPRYGQTHPNNGGIVVDSIAAVPIAGDVGKAHVIVTYGAPTFQTQAPSEKAEPTYRTASTTQDVETSEDKDGKQMVLTHTKVTVNPTTGQNVSEVLPAQPVKASVQRPITTFICERAEPLPWNYPGKLPFVGCTNKTPWRNYPARTVLCMGINVDENGDRANVSYQFQIKLDGTKWELRAVYIDPATGSPVENPVEGKGIKTFQVYPEADFNQLSV